MEVVHHGSDHSLPLGPASPPHTAGIEVGRGPESDLKKARVAAIERTTWKLHPIFAQAAKQLAAMVGKELGELSEANRQLASLVRFGHYKLKQAIWQKQGARVRSSGLDPRIINI